MSRRSSSGNFSNGNYWWPKRLVTARARKNSASEALADSYTCFFYATKCKDIYSAFVTILRTLIAFVLLALVVVLIHWLFPDATKLIRELADWANDYGPYGAVLFAFVAGFVMLIPGVPGSLLCFTCGAVFPFWTGLTVAVSLFQRTNYSCL
mmetsp:Transcript_7071/g.9235  ORF Transcript_7071/g.9235 Transcript_7071/m.9235 type:complete len:152 (-) Transcript_7071:1313-1768(-)